MNTRYVDELQNILKEAYQKGYKQIKTIEKGNRFPITKRYTFINDTLIRLKCRKYEVGRLYSKKMSGFTHSDIDFSLKYYNYTYNYFIYQELDSAEFHILKAFSPASKTVGQELNYKTMSKKDSLGRLLEHRVLDIYSEESRTYREYKSDTTFVKSYTIDKGQQTLVDSSFLFTQPLLMGEKNQKNRTHTFSLGAIPDSREVTYKDIVRSNKKGLTTKIETSYLDKSIIDSNDSYFENWSLSIRYIK